MKLKYVAEKDLQYFLYALVVVYFANMGGLTTAFLSQNIVKGLMLTTFICFPLLYFSKSRGKIQKKYFNICTYYILFFLLMLPNSGWSIFSIIRYLGILMLSIFALNSKKTIEYTIDILYFVYIIYAVFTFAEFFNRKFYFHYVYPLFQDTSGLLTNAYKLGYMAGITGHYSSNATFLTCGLLIAATRYLASKEKKNFWMSLFILAALLLTGKRAHILFVMVALYVMYYFSLSDLEVKNKLLKSIGIIVVSVCAGVIVLNTIPALSIVIARLQKFMEGNDSSTQVRLRLWSLAVNEFKNHPILGIGWEQFYSKLSYKVGSNRNFEVHNVYLQLLCETGIIGFLIYVSWFVYMLKNAVKVYKKIVIRGFSIYDLKMIGFALAFQIFFLLYCFTGNPLYDWKVNIPYFLSCSIVYLYKIRLNAPAQFEHKCD